MRFALCSCLLALALPVSGQQSYVGRFDAYAGYTYLDSPALSLNQNGFHTQVGIRPRTWFSLGFDYSVANGNGSITPNLLTAALQQQLGAVLAQLASAGKIPAGYNLVLPFHALTQNFAAGPQFAYRHWSAVTLFFRPSIGAVHERATLRPADPIAAAIAAQLAPSGNKQDWAAFYGFGGGADLNFSQHFAVRVQADFVHDHLFSDLLKNGRNTVRVSVGPAVQFGRNVMK
ncbi:MAG: hypothetical protein JO210_12640 [Acidobacteriaceae bacterium]|nr:hypothetical protein [Acidobacteriaceae bacterium]